MAKILVGGLEFKSQKSLKKHVQALYSEIGATNDIPAKYHLFLNDLVARHPSAKEKIGCGVSRYKLIPNPVTPQFFELNIVRTDGSVTEVSYNKCVTGRERTVKAAFSSALRYAVNDQIMAFRWAELEKSKYCRRCGDNLHRGIHIDHDIPFATLAENFTKLYPDLPTEFDECTRIHQHIFRASDAEYSKAWQEYHRQNAVLILSCAGCNIRRETNKGEKMKSDKMGDKVQELKTLLTGVRQLLKEVGLGSGWDINPETGTAELPGIQVSATIHTDHSVPIKDAFITAYGIGGVFFQKMEGLNDEQMNGPLPKHFIPYSQIISIVEDCH